MTAFLNSQDDTTGNWYKGNVHIHSTASDGGKTFVELADMYAGAGYDFLVRADHWVSSDAASDPADYPLLWLDGIEIDGTDRGGSWYHVVCLGTFTGLTREIGLIAAMESARAQGGLIILAHPFWMGNSSEDVLRWGFDGIEIYNHLCQWMNGKGDGGVHWDAALGRFDHTLAFAVDDAHISDNHPGWDGGWIVVNAAERTREAIGGSIRAGNFYSSCGPQFRAIRCDGATATVRTSPVSLIYLVGPGAGGSRIGLPAGEPIDEASFEIPGHWSYAYVQIEDADGRRAWTNNLLAPAQEAVE